MYKLQAVHVLFIVFFLISTPGIAGLYTFDDFSSLSMGDELSGKLSIDDFEVTFSGDNGGIITDKANSSLNGLALGTYYRKYTSQLLLSFNLPVIKLILEFDAMHERQEDSVMASTGMWINFPDSLVLTDQTLSSTSDVYHNGIAGVDDDLFCTLTFNDPVYTVSFSNVGAFVLDSFTANTIPEPATVLLFGLGGLTFLRKRR